MKKCGMSQQGFTLVELIVSMSVTLVLLAALASLLSNSLKAYQINSHRSEVQQTARIAADTIAREFKLAKGITSVKDDNNSITFTAPGTSGDDTITIYRGSDGILYINRNAGNQPITGANNVIITKNNNNPIFIVTGNNHILQINFTAQYVGDNTATETITTSVTGMNIPKT